MRWIANPVFVGSNPTRTSKYKYNMDIKRYLNVVAESNLLTVEQILVNRTWKIQSSNPNDFSIFLMSDLKEDEIIFFEGIFSNLIVDYIHENNIKEEILFERAYINGHPCYHPGDWHTDNPFGFTALYYPLSKTDFGFEGATDFKDIGPQYYIGNSLLIFPSNILHMATEHSQKGILRYSIAFKFKILNDLEEERFIFA